MVENQSENIVWKSTKWFFKGVYKVAYNIGGFFACIFGFTSTPYDYAIRQYEISESQRHQMEEEPNGKLANFPPV